MRKSRFTTEQIISFIKQAEAGMAVSEPGRQHGFNPGQLLRLAGQVRGMEADDAKPLRELESENNRLQRLLQNRWRSTDRSTYIDIGMSDIYRRVELPLRNRASALRSIERMGCHPTVALSTRTCRVRRQ